MKVVVNRDNCIGCGACEAICPEVFNLDDDGLSTVICDNFKDIDESSISEAIESCPTNAISKENE